MPAALYLPAIACASHTIASPALPPLPCHEAAAAGLLICRSTLITPQAAASLHSFTACLHQSPGARGAPASRTMCSWLSSEMRTCWEESNIRTHWVCQSASASARQQALQHSMSHVQMCPFTALSLPGCWTTPGRRCAGTRCAPAAPAGARTGAVAEQT